MPLPATASRCPGTADVRRGSPAAQSPRGIRLQATQDSSFLGFNNNFVFSTNNSPLCLSQVSWGGGEPVAWQCSANGSPASTASSLGSLTHLGDTAACMIRILILAIVRSYIPNVSTWNRFWNVRKIAIIEYDLRKQMVTMCLVLPSSAACYSHKWKQLWYLRYYKPKIWIKRRMLNISWNLNIIEYWNKRIERI